MSCYRSNSNKNELLDTFMSKTTSLNESKERGIFFKFTVVSLILIVTSVCLVIFAEFFLRYYFRDVLSTAYGITYFSQKHLPTLKQEFNGFRLRGKDFLAQADERYRVVVLGDSLTFGQGVFPYTERFTEKVEVFFNQKTTGRKIEMINTGINGHDLPHHIKYLPTIYTLNPNFVLYQWYLNDMDVTPKLSQFVAPHVIKNKRIHNYLWQRSVLYFLVQKKYGQLVKKKGKQKSYTKYLTDRFSDPDRKPAKKAKKLLLKMVRTMKDKKVDFGIVLFPGFYGPMDDYSLNFLHEQVLTVCEEEELNCLDLRETYKSFPFMELWANVLDPHPSALAHQIAAKAIYQHFGPVWQTAIENSKPEAGSVQ